MSLTGHIKDMRSPVRAFLFDNLPNTKFEQFRIKQDGILAGQTLTMTSAIRWDPGEASIMPADEDGRYPWGGVGTAFDFRLRYLYQVTPPEKLVAQHGAQRLRHVFRVKHELPAWIQLKAKLAEIAPELGRRAPLPHSEDELWINRLCYTLALYEQCYRGFMILDWPIVGLGADASLDDVLDLCPVGVPEDIAAMIALYCETQSELLRAESLRLNPTFAASRLLGGADADLILDGTLFDVKTSKRVRPQRPELWQLAGYVLADLDDQHHVDAVGLYFARYGSSISWPLDEFFDRLAGHHVDIAEMRVAFGTMLGAAQVGSTPGSESKVNAMAVQ
jgi:hypothetical protein